MRPKVARNAQGESPPVRRRPWKKKRLRDGWSSYLRTARPPGACSGDSASGGPIEGDGGVGMKEGVGEADGEEDEERWGEGDRESDGGRGE
jgi:hypothetical protein